MRFYLNSLPCSQLGISIFLDFLPYPLHLFFFRLKFLLTFQSSLQGHLFPPQASISFILSFIIFQSRTSNFLVKLVHFQASKNCRLFTDAIGFSGPIIYVVNWWFRMRSLLIFLSDLTGSDYKRLRTVWLNSFKIRRTVSYCLFCRNSISFPSLWTVNYKRNSKLQHNGKHHPQIILYNRKALCNGNLALTGWNKIRFEKSHTHPKSISRLT